MKQGVYVLVLATGLAGCGGQPVTHINYHEIDPSKGMFADTLTWEWRRKAEPAAASAAAAAPAAAATVAAPQTAAPSATELEDFKTWRDSAGASERSEFEEWRAWQEWKRKNPK
jgi:hypothetical protein